MSSEVILERPNFIRARRDALGILDRLGIEAPPIDPVKLSRELGLSVYFVRFSGEYVKVSGFYDAEDNAVFVNSDEYPLRQTFTVAHELGHYVMHKEWVRSADYKILMRDSLYSGDDSREKEANTFAANLLVPRFMLDQYWKMMPVEQLSQLFAVSVPVIKNRLAFEYGL
jgi:Zn-dependent peptidase ImmA (M78 family)